ncbi:MAG: beta-ketoacyl-ACP synthase II [Proteobacteria bacterium]|nr:beta-ketoacyl-ACP synthase II [Pseudomonadota bacterium]
MRDSADARVVVTGLGCITPLGAGVDDTFEAALAGRSGVGPIRQFDATGFPARIAAEVDAEIDVGDLPAKEVRRMDRGVQFAVAAAREAVADAKLELSDAQRNRAGVAIGSGVGGLGTFLENERKLREQGPRRVSPFSIPMGIANMPSGVVSIQHGLRGPNLCHVSACATGTHAVGEGARAVARGDADVMVVGGSEAPILGLSLAGFAAMRALSVRNDDPEAASRPFDRGRDGFVIGEGAAVLVLESLAHAEARGARVRAEVVGYAATADALHMAAPDEGGEGALRCMRMALEDAGEPSEAVGYINAHATSTPAGDRAEARAIQALLGDRAGAVPVSATKSMTGHLLGAAGALEAILCVRALEAGQLPPTINLDDPDPDCALDHVVGTGRRAEIRLALSNSFGFGGTNASLLLAAAR